MPQWKYCKKNLYVCKFYVAAHFAYEGGCASHRSIQPGDSSATTWYRDDATTCILSGGLSTSLTHRQRRFTYGTWNTSTSKPHSLLSTLLLNGQHRFYGCRMLGDRF